MPDLTPSQQALVQVFDTADETEAMVIQGLLDSAGIESMITSPDAPQEVMPGLGGVVIRVRADQAATAKQLIEDYRASSAVEVTEEAGGDFPPSE